MTWAAKRKFIYAIAVLTTLSAFFVYFFRDTIFPAPTCIDQKQNGYESGVDCGGSCALKCIQEVSPLSVVWAKAIRSGSGLYDLVAMINNANIDNASQEIGFIFIAYDRQGKVLASLSGSTTAPLAGKFPVIIQSVPFEVVPFNVVATLSDGAHYSVKESPSSPTVRVTSRRYEQDSISRVFANVTNTKHIEINNLPVRVVLFDEQNNSYAVGQTIIPLLPKVGTKEVVFTWKELLPFAPAKIEVYPIFNPFDAIEY